MNRGFTVVEILVTLVVMAIILTLGTVNLRGSLANGRDSERKSDIESIARGLEQRYENGNAIRALPVTPVNDWPDSTAYGKGWYPGVNELRHMQGQNMSGFNPTSVSGGYLSRNLPGTSDSIITTPNGNAIIPVCTSSCAAAGNNSQISNALGSDRDKYVYEPITDTGAVCLTGICTSYKLYWVSEVDTTTYKGIAGLKEAKSKHQ